MAEKKTQKQGEKNTKKTEKAPKKKVRANISENGRFYITATFNNTLVTVTDDKGNTVAWSSAGSSGFKGTRKSTPYAATVAVEQVAKKGLERGLKTVEVYVKGPGSGRDSALRAIRSSGLSISMIADITPIPHNGPRAEKKRRV
ncbi:MAG: 30S ribosomal protein S11 [Patescibacteria group bacterium]|nr:30S ribosomal protein S11 [Patescibacteria group bacterium]